MAAAYVRAGVGMGFGVEFAAISVMKEKRPMLVAVSLYNMCQL